MLEKLEALDLPLLMAVAMEETASEATRVQKDQLWKGLKSDDTGIVPDYAPITVMYKLSKGHPYSRVTLRDFGDFYAGIFLDVRGVEFVIESQDEKSGELQARYGTDIFGFGSKAQAEYIKSLQPEFVDWIRKDLK